MVMDADIITSYSDIQIYKSDIDMLTSEYIDNLPSETSIYKSAAFYGLLEYLYKHCLKNVIINRVPYGYDYKVLNDIFYGVYVPLCTAYSITPTVLQFCTMVHIDNANISDIYKGVYRGNGSKAKPENTQYVKKWYQTCESGMLSRAVNESSIGSIFGLKSVYSYSENNTLTIQTDTITHDTAEQIASRHNTVLIPEKPSIDTD